EYTPPVAAKRLSLMDALEQGLRQNADQKTRKFQFELYDLEYKDDYEDFWFPKVSLVMNTNAHLVEKLFADNSSGEGTTKTPNGYIGLELSDYTLFNWGRDYLEYLNT